MDIAARKRYCRTGGLTRSGHTITKQALFVGLQPQSCIAQTSAEVHTGKEALRKVRRQNAKWKRFRIVRHRISSEYKTLWYAPGRGSGGPSPYRWRPRSRRCGRGLRQAQSSPPSSRV